MKTMGIDYGTKRIGIALSDEGETLAFPQAIIPCDESASDAIVRIAVQESVGMIVVGESVSPSGGPNAIMDAIVPFTHALEEKTGLPVVFEKESFTSVEARRMQGAASPVDASAAALILQRYLDRKNR